MSCLRTGHAGKQGRQRVDLWLRRRLGMSTSSPSTDGNHFLLTNTLAKWGQNVQASGSATYTFSHIPGGGWKMTPITSQPESGIVANLVYEYYQRRLFAVSRQPRMANLLCQLDLQITEYALGPAGGPYKTVATEPTEVGTWLRRYLARAVEGRKGCGDRIARSRTHPGSPYADDGSATRISMPA